MCNCNSKRQAFTQKKDDIYKGMIKVRLKENKPLVLNGDISGRMYIFRELHDTLWVDKRDVLFLEKRKDLEIIH